MSIVLLPFSLHAQVGNIGTFMNNYTMLKIKPFSLKSIIFKRGKTEELVSGFHIWFGNLLDIAL